MSRNTILLRRVVLLGGGLLPFLFSHPRAAADQSLTNPAVLQTGYPTTGAYPSGVYPAGAYPTGAYPAVIPNFGEPGSPLPVNPNILKDELEGEMGYLEATRMQERQAFENYQANQNNLPEGKRKARRALKKAMAQRALMEQQYQQNETAIFGAERAIAAATEEISAESARNGQVIEIVQVRPNPPPAPLQTFPIPGAGNLPPNGVITDPAPRTGAPLLTGVNRSPNPETAVNETRPQPLPTVRPY